MKYLEAQKELKRVLNEQQTIKVSKLRGIIHSLNVPLQPGETLPTSETDYLKRLLKKKNDKLAVMGGELKKLQRGRKNA